MQRDVDQLLNDLRVVVDVVAETVGSYCEVVLHDLRQPKTSVVHVAHGHVTNRAVNQGIRDLLGVLNSPNFVGDTLINYAPSIPTGERSIRSSTAIFRNEIGDPVVALCMNLDVTPFSQIKDIMDSLSETHPEVAAIQNPTVVAGSTEVIAMVDQIILNTIESTGLPVEQMRKPDKLEIVAFLSERGAFQTRGAVARLAKHLKISPHSVYKYLQELKRNPNEMDTVGQEQRVKER